MPLLSVEEALAAILQAAGPLPAETVPLAAAFGRVLSRDLASDVESPPFDKSMMDGYAVIAADIAATGTVLPVVASVMAGQVSPVPLESGQAIRIMTGAPIPPGADAVVPVELTEPLDDTEQIRFTKPLPAGANILRRGESMAVGEHLFSAGHVLRPQDLGLLAELGIAAVPVHAKPKVAILATGDELVAPGETPQPGQIRNSNESLLIGLVQAAGGEPIPLGIARDNEPDLRAKIDQGLAADLLLLSGGVSAGVLDLVPATLQAAGVDQIFHKVNIKPGKPIWFGRKPEGCLVFGLPGNPVSVLACFELFAKTALNILAGRRSVKPRTLPAKLMVDWNNRGDRVTCFPARLAIDETGTLTATPVRWAGSADQRATIAANGVAIFQPGQQLTAGIIVETLLWPGEFFGGEASRETAS